MAEERIVFTIYTENPCADCGNPYKPNCGNGEHPACNHKKNYAEGMTRAEAIEKMAKAIFPLNFTPLEIKGKNWDNLTGWQKGNCLRQAEAALNALLGEWL